MSDFPPSLAAFDSLRVWSSGDKRAPHKPLLVLYALGRLARGELDPVPYADVDSHLGQLLRDFGRNQQRYHPEYPFWFLKSDGVWKVDLDRPDELTLRVGNTNPSRSELIAQRARGAFSAEIQRALLERPAFIVDVARLLLDEHFPETLHGDILDSVGLDLTSFDRQLVTRRPRDPAFRNQVLAAYEDRCAVCGYDLSLDRRPLGIEAAHIRWHQYHGPDVVTNGLALCSQHHKVFDRGAFTVVEDDRVVVSDRVRGRDGLHEVLMRHHGQPLRAPVHREHAPDVGHLAWHRQEVFRGEPRPVV